MAEQQATTRERINETALRLFADKGVGQTTTKDIAQGAGVAEGTLYRHYEGKDDMIWRLFSSNYIHLADELDRLQEAETALNAKIAVMVRAFCELYEQAPDIFRFLFLVQHGQLDRLSPGMTTPVQVVRDVIAEAIDRGEIPPQDPELGAAMVFGLVTQPAVFKIYGRIQAPLTDLSGRLSRACMHVLNA